MWFSLTFPVCSKFPDFSLTGKCLPIFPGFPVRVGTLYYYVSKAPDKVSLQALFPPFPQKNSRIFTVRNDVAARLYFHRCLSVILFTGGGAWRGCLADTPPGQTPPPPDGHCSGRYASYWNAFLFQNMFETMGFHFPPPKNSRIFPEYVRNNGWVDSKANNRV